MLFWTYFSGHFAFRCLLDLGPLRSDNLLFKKQHKHWYRSKISKYLWWWVLHIKTKSYFDKTSSLCTNVLSQDRASSGKAIQQKFESSHNVSTNDSSSNCYALLWLVEGLDKIHKFYSFSGYELTNSEKLIQIPKKFVDSLCQTLSYWSLVCMYLEKARAGVYWNVRICI